MLRQLALGFLEKPRQRLRLLRADHQHFTADQKTRHAGNAQIARGGIIIAGLFNIGIGGKEAGNQRRVHIMRGGNIKQHLGFANILSLFEIAREQRLRDLMLKASAGRPTNKPVSVHGVGCSGDFVKGEVDAGSFSHRHDVFHNMFATIGAKFGAHLFFAVIALWRCCRVKLEGTPHQIDRHIAQTCQRGVKLALANKAPRANHIGDDVELQDGVFARFVCIVCIVRIAGSGHLFLPDAVQ